MGLFLLPGHAFFLLSLSRLLLFFTFILKKRIINFQLCLFLERAYKGFKQFLLLFLGLGRYYHILDLVKSLNFYILPIKEFYYMKRRTGRNYWAQFPCLFQLERRIFELRNAGGSPLNISQISAL